MEDSKLSSLSTPKETGLRFSEIDVAKGIGILLVIFFHIHPSGPTCDIVYSFHMPLFFLFPDSCS